MLPFYDAVLVALIGLYLILTPFTKVEESFNIQAIHDLLYYGFDVSKFDHIEFPGAVPRTFIGSLIVAGLSKPFIGLIPDTALKLDQQLVARGVLGVINAFGILYLKNSVIAQFKKNKRNPVQEKQEHVAKGKPHTKKNAVQKKAHQVEELHRFGSLSIWFAIIQFSQFHLVYYASRTLPNFFALPLTNYAFGKLIRGDYSTAVTVLAFTTVVFRIEIVALTLSVGFFLLISKKLTIRELVKTGLTGGLVGGALSFVIDSYFWRRFTIPELESFVFNVIQGRSSEWGTTPFTQYFSGAMLTLFLPPLAPLLAILGGWKDLTGNNTLKIAAYSSLLFVVLISFQPHKEWRFICYVVPVVNVLAANGASFITSKAYKSIWFKFLVLILLGSFSLTAIISGCWSYASSFNYPGGFAIHKFHEKIIMKKALDQLKIDPVVLHFDAATATTGVSRFCEVTDLLNLTVIYDKTEDPVKLNQSETWSHFDYVISEYDLEKREHRTAFPYLEDWRWAKIDTIKAFGGLDVKGVRHLNFVAMFRDLIKDKNLIPLAKTIRPFLHMTEQLFIYERVPAPPKKEEKEKATEAPVAEEVIEVVTEDIEEPVVEDIEVGNESTQEDKSAEITGEALVIEGDATEEENVVVKDTPADNTVEAPETVEEELVEPVLYANVEKREEPTENVQAKDVPERKVVEIDIEEELKEESEAAEVQQQEDEEPIEEEEIVEPTDAPTEDAVTEDIDIETTEEFVDADEE